MSALLVALLASCGLTLGVIRWANRHPTLTHDHDVLGPQKFHARAVPRVGGLAVVGALLLAMLAGMRGHAEARTLGLVLVACSLPVLGAGLVEDVTKQLSPRRRLLFGALSAALAAVFLGTNITRTDLPGLDWVVTFTAGSMMLTVFTVTGVSNAINIIDGFNGLAAMCVAIMLMGLASVAFDVGDPAVGWLALAGIGAVFGFFVWNFPAGLVFLGDGGAYFLGFYVAELSLLLIARNPEVSPLFPLLLCFYPIFETLFSVYRRRVLHLRAVGMPDGVHLHSLIYRRVLRWAAGERTARELTRRNSMTSPYLWVMCMFSVVPAVLFWDNSLWIGLFLALFGLGYLALYWRIVRFRAPRVLRLFGSRPMPLDTRPADARDNPET